MFFTNQRKYQPNLYGEDMVLEYTKEFKHLDLIGKQLNYEFEKHEAESEESFLGLGIMPKNIKTWFALSQQPKVQELFFAENTLIQVAFSLK